VGKDELIDLAFVVIFLIAEELLKTGNFGFKGDVVAGGVGLGEVGAVREGVGAVPVLREGVAGDESVFAACFLDDVEQFVVFDGEYFDLVPEFADLFLAKSFFPLPIWRFLDWMAGLLSAPGVVLV
jgi:hypothetical protein